MRQLLSQITCQVAGFILATLTLYILPSPLQIPSIFLTLAALYPALLAKACRTPWWWVCIQCAFTPSIALCLHLEIPPSWFLGGFALLIAFNIGALSSQAPLFLSSNTTLVEVQKVLITIKPTSFLDLGAGTGTALAFLSKTNQSIQFNGIEQSIGCWLVGKIRTRKFSNCQIMRGDFWTSEWPTAQFIYAFLSPAAMPRLHKDIRRRISEPCWVLSNSFPIPDATPTMSIPIANNPSQSLYLYQLTPNTHPTKGEALFEQ